MKLGTIKKELEDCKAAWKSVPNAKWAWCCHHNILIEALVHSWEVRIECILKYKEKNERAVRFRNFRPVRVTIPAKLEKCGIEYTNAWNKLGHSHPKSTTHKILAAIAKYNKTMSKLPTDKWIELYDKDWPDNTWSGESIFGKNKIEKKQVYKKTIITDAPTSIGSSSNTTIPDDGI